MKNPDYIPRRIEPTIRKYARQFPAVLLTGPRQSGKSTTLEKLFGTTHRMVSFDDPLVREQALADPRLFLGGLPERLIFDEIQYAPQLLSYLKMRIDQKRRDKGTYIMTGSQQFSLMKGVSETLAGRVGLLSLLQFDYKETAESRHFPPHSKSGRRLFVNACLAGSYPEPNTDSRVKPANWYGSYLTTYLERDIRTVYNIGSLREFQKFMQLLAGRCAQILNLSNIANELGVSANTIKSWVSVLEASQIIYLLPPYFKNLGKRISRNPKVYFLDCGLVCYLTGISNQDLLLKGPLAGPLFENYCVQETVKSYLNKGQRPNIFFLRTHNGLEVDLLIARDFRLYPIEIKLTQSPSGGLAAAIERFGKLFSELKIMPGKVVCLTEENINLTRKVQAQNVFDYLEDLNRDSSR